MIKAYDNDKPKLCASENLDNVKKSWILEKFFVTSLLMNQIKIVS